MELVLTEPELLDGLKVADAKARKLAQRMPSINLDGERLYPLRLVQDWLDQQALTTSAGGAA